MIASLLKNSDDSRLVDDASEHSQAKNEIISFGFQIDREEYNSLETSESLNKTSSIVGGRAVARSGPSWHRHRGRIGCGFVCSLSESESGEDSSEASLEKHIETRETKVG